MKKTQYTDPAFKQLFAEINPEIAKTFTVEQLEAIKRGLDSRPRIRHPLDIRVSVPIPGLRFYLVLLAGSERRSQVRLRSEKGLYPFWTPANILFLLGFLIILSICSYTIFSSALSSLSPTSSSFYPTSIPWIEDESECKHTGRIWNNGKCWDFEQSPNF